MANLKDTKQMTAKNRAFGILNLIGNTLGLILLFIFVFIASFLLISYLKGSGGIDIIGLWRGFYAAF